MSQARILSAFIHRLSSKELQKMVETVKEAEYASLHWGNSAQLEAHRNIDKAVEHAVSTIGSHDRERIESVITDHVHPTEEV